MSVKGVASVTPTAKRPERRLSLWQAYVAELNGHRQMTVGERRKGAVIVLAVLLVGGTILGIVVISFGNSQAYKEGHNTAYQGAVELSKISRIEKEEDAETVAKQHNLEVIVLRALAIAKPGETTPEEFQFLVNTVAMQSGLVAASLMPTHQECSTLPNGNELLGIVYNPRGPRSIVVGFKKDILTGRWVVVIGTNRGETYIAGSLSH
jgi:hypothetical protein